MALTSCHDWVVVQMVLVGSLLAFFSFAERSAAWPTVDCACLLVLRSHVGD